MMQLIKINIQYNCLDKGILICDAHGSCLTVALILKQFFSLVVEEHY